MDSASVLRLLPRGAYTTCRTLGGGQSVYQLEHHVRRLTKTSRLMIEDGSGEGAEGGEAGGEEEEEEKQI